MGVRLVVFSVLVAFSFVAQARDPCEPIRIGAKAWFDRDFDTVENVLGSSVFWYFDARLDKHFLHGEFLRELDRRVLLKDVEVVKCFSDGKREGLAMLRVNSILDATDQDESTLWWAFETNDAGDAVSTLKWYEDADALIVLRVFDIHAVPVVGGSTSRMEVTLRPMSGFNKIFFRDEGDTARVYGRDLEHDASISSDQGDVEQSDVAVEL